MTPAQLGAAISPGCSSGSRRRHSATPTHKCGSRAKNRNAHLAVAPEKTTWRCGDSQGRPFWTLQPWLLTFSWKKPNSSHVAFTCEYRVAPSSLPTMLAATSCCFTRRSFTKTEFNCQLCQWPKAIPIKNKLKKFPTTTLAPPSMADVPIPTPTYWVWLHQRATIVSGRSHVIVIVTIPVVYVIRDTIPR